MATPFRKPCIHWQSSFKNVCRCIIKRKLNDLKNVETKQDFENINSVLDEATKFLKENEPHNNRDNLEDLDIYKLVIKKRREQSEYQRRVCFSSRETSLFKT